MNKRTVYFWIPLAFWLFALAVAQYAFSAESVGRVTISWTAPDKNTDGSAVAVPLKYVVLRDGARLATVTATNVTLAAEPTGKRCYRIIAVVASGATAGVESEPTNEICKVVRLAAPSDGKLTAPSDGALE